VEKITGEYLNLSSYVKESTRRGESIEMYMINRTTGDVISAPINPNFVAGILRTGILTSYKILGMKNQSK
jgi:hypothetical protein